MEWVIFDLLVAVVVAAALLGAVVAPNSRQIGLKGAFLDAYRRTGENAEPWLDLLFRKDTSNGAFEDYNVPLDAPGLLIWPDGDPVPEGGMSELGYRVVHTRWARSVDYSKLEASDNRSMRSHADRARLVGEDGGLLRERSAYSLMSGSTSLDALDSIPLAFDGLPFYSQEHREHTNGNIVGFQGQLNDERTLINGLINLGVRRFREMVKPRNASSGARPRKLFSQGEIDRATFHLFFAPEYEGLFIDALDSQTIYRSETVQESNQNVGGMAAAPDNAKARKYRGRFVPHIFGEMSASDGVLMMMSIPGSDKKPWIEIERQALKFTFFGQDNDSDARRYGREGVQVELRRGYGAHMHYMMLHLDTNTSVQ